MSSKLKVLQVIPRLDYGGAEIGCFDLAHYLSEQKSISYIASSGGKLTKYINKKKVKKELNYEFIYPSYKEGLMQ